MELERKLSVLAPWFHNLHLPDGTQAAPDHFLGAFPSFKWRGHESYLCEPNPDAPSCITTWNMAEFLSAVKARDA
jgi:hypothetical protein